MNAYRVRLILLSRCYKDSGTLTKLTNLISLIRPSYVSECLNSIKIPAIGGRFSVLNQIFWGQKHGCKDFEVPYHI